MTSERPNWPMARRVSRRLTSERKMRLVRRAR